MKSLRLAFIIALLIAAASDQLAAQNPAGAASDEVRKALDQQYATWGKARIAGDQDVFERMLAPEFFVQFAEKRATRREFIQQISNRPNTTKRRFDSKILTVQPNGEAWETVIFEKLEYVWKDKENKAHEVFALWVTRDGWKKDGNDWKVLYSKELSHELWENGAHPPLADW